jgi:predicted small metal-binding protein
MALEFACRNVGLVDCKGVVHAATEDELLRLVAEHARTVHGVELNQTLVDYARTTVTER